jgi:hypothetical protein
MMEAKTSTPVDGGIAVSFCETSHAYRMSRHDSIIRRTGTCTSVTVEMIE